jgi:LPS-assembly protein
MKLTADEATYEEISGELVARGHVVFTDPESYLEADQAHYNVRTQAGWFLNGHGYVHAKVHPRALMLTTANPFYLQALRVDRLDEDTYAVQNGRFSTCECENKGWSISARHARVEVDDKLVSHDALFRLLDVPLFYSPFLEHPIARNPRSTGFLIPYLGNSTQKGIIAGDAFYWAINPSADLLGGAEYYSKRGWGRRARFRARPNDTSDLTVDYTGITDRGIVVPTSSLPVGAIAAPGPTPGTSILRASGQSIAAVGKTEDLGLGFRGVVDVDYISSLLYRETWTDTFTEAVSSEARQTGFLTKDFDAYSMNIYASRYQNFLSAAQVPGNSVTIRQAPSISFTGIDKQVAESPVYFSFETSAAGVGRAEPGLKLPAISERLDFSPRALFRLRPFWGFHLTPSIAVRATRYGTSLAPSHDPLNRLLAEFSLDLRPPSLEKVLAKTYWGYRVKHIIEPDIRYDLVRVHDPESIMDVVRYDAIDILAQTNEIEYSLTNSFLARKDVPDGTGAPQAHEIFSWRLSQKYYFDPTFGGALQPNTLNVLAPTISLTGFAFAYGQRLSPVVSVVKFAPFSNYDTELRTDLNPKDGGVLNAGITSHVRRGPLGLTLTDFFINRTAALFTPVMTTNTSLLPSFHLFRAVISYGDVNRKGFSGAFGADYNFSQKIAQQMVTQLGYNFGCFGLDFEYRRFDLGPLREENQYRVALSLANVGTFGNLRRRERLY